MKKLLLCLCMVTLVHAENPPLAGKKFGVEFNFPRLLTYNDSWQSFSGTFSYFDHENKAEIALPWVISKNQSSNNDDDFLDITTVDMQYRKFIDNKLNGVYFSGVGRLAHLDGNLRDQTANQRTLKFGVGVGLGYRLFPQSNRFYWGTSLVMGRFIVGENDIYDNSGIDFLNFDDQAFFVDIEFLKFGYAF